MGRKDPLAPGEVFPSLKDLPAASEEEDEDIDPRDTMAMFQTMNAPRLKHMRVAKPEQS